MKWLFVLLLAVNAIFFGWSFAESVSRDGINSEFRTTSIGVGDKLRLLGEMERLPAPRGGDDWLPQYGEWEDEDTESLVAEQAVATQGQVQAGGVIEYDQDATILMDNNWDYGETTCHSFGPIFLDADADKLQGHLEKYQLPYVRRTEESVETYYGVYLRAEKTVVALAELIEKMKSRGVNNYRLVSSGELRNNLSLGVYTDREKVDARLSELRNKGFEPIVVPEYGDDGIWVDVLVESHLADADFMELLNERDDRFVIECEETGLASASDDAVTDGDLQQ